ncbi:MAG: sensor histidine kinase [Cumulibacter sp.]
MTVSNAELATWQRPAADAEQIRNDMLGAVGLFLLGIMSVVLTIAIGIYGEDGAAPAVSVGLVAATTLPLGLRRRVPTAVLAIVAIAFIVAGELVVGETIVMNIGLFCAIYTVGAWESDRVRAAWARIACIAVMAVWLIIGMFRIAGEDLGTDGGGIGALTPNIGFMLQNLLINALYFAGAYWFGEHAWNAARQRSVLQQRTRELAAEKARATRQAVTIERLRIARELHDAVAHHVSLMGVQAAAARAILPRDIDGAQAQLTALEDSARAAVAELYALLGTLRDDDGAEPVESRPLPGVDGIEQLVAEAAATGLEVSIVEVGERRDIPPLIGLNLYRITQEALTNTTKHAGQTARAVVTVRYLDDAVELEVADDGRRRGLPQSHGIGLGLPSMRERVASLGGELIAEPRSGSGFVVRAHVPTPATSARVAS